MQLSAELQRAVDEAGTPLRLTDPRTGKAYLLVAEGIASASHGSSSDSLAETYRAQIESALAAGWSDPTMDEYNEYDRYRKP
jgi:hypothetical protein